MAAAFIAAVRWARVENLSPTPKVTFRLAIRNARELLLVRQRE